jgi:hypothetical protein
MVKSGAEPLTRLDHQLGAVENSMFDKELAYYKEHRAEFLAKYEWKHVLIKGSELIGVFDSAEAAYAEGLHRFGNNPFLIKQVLREERIEQIPALSLGILHAST